MNLIVVILIRTINETFANLSFFFDDFVKPHCRQFPNPLAICKYSSITKNQYRNTNVLDYDKSWIRETAVKRFEIVEKVIFHWKLKQMYPP